MSTYNCRGAINGIIVQNNPVNFIDPSGLDWLDTSANFSAGLGDALLLGLGDNLRHALGMGDIVDTCSNAYKYGGWASFAFGTTRLGYAAAAKVGSKLASSAIRASSFRNSLKNAVRLGFGKKWRTPNLSKYPTDEALRAAAGRTNPYINAYGAGVTAAGASGATN
ncbi:MAG: hypothetical protein GY941_14090 [Planctomycetes bacterium]|nr:hypothetical protein [Planctomycetota bacterium]